jgi:hypothetical protein
MNRESHAARSDQVASGKENPSLPRIFRVTGHQAVLAKRGLAQLALGLGALRNRAVASAIVIGAACASSGAIPRSARLSLDDQLLRAAS